ncbi:arylsulfatase [Flavivirga rizhaonensis]|uniref:N-acetylgalactosamine-6-sulfatase n=1 Tax=Flavivirga rizhaonensis TaxID=2559571 RepID=A0A4V3P5A9_9FLAO|nr:arylsulfatase [Flavivirga rizhaonensis]TGV04614.1 N-acetylgalactosamine-6-sulfatase [Flavivirga rizhaonensis]
MKLSKIVLTPLSLLVFGLMLFACKGEKSPYKNTIGSKPNIIFILADDLGYGDLGCYGQMEIKTPNIDKFASQGVQFLQHYAGATVCAPSRNCLMTGQHNGNATIKTMEKPIKAEDITVAELLKTAGYSTAMIGKWGLGNVGTTGFTNDQGFDYSFGYYDQIRAHNYYPDYLMENSKQYPLENKVIYIEDSTHYAVGIGNAAVEKKQYSNDVFTEKALDYLDKTDSNPFFLYLAYTIPHANNESWLIKEHGMEVPDLGMYANKDWAEEKKAGAAMISRLDGYVGSIMKKLLEKGIDKETIVIFSSDNGPHGEGGWNPNFFNSSGGLKGMKRDLYEGGIRVPFIVRWPDIITPRQSNHISAFWDFMPTACDLAGVQLPDSSDGISFLSTLLNEDKNQPVHDYLYWEFRISSVDRQAVRKGDWKAVRIKKGNPLVTKVELFNLLEDKAEKNDLSEEHPVIVKELVSIMNQYPKE